jgi:hypothetical protein
MATITQRPAAIVCVGGSYTTNEVVYKLSSSNNFEEIEIWDNDTSSLLTKIRASVIDGIATFEISKVLQNIFIPYNFVRNGADANYFKTIYIKGDGINDIANLINVVFAKVNGTLNSSFLSYANVYSVNPPFPILNKMPLKLINGFCQISYIYQKIDDKTFRISQGLSNTPIILTTVSGLFRAIVTTEINVRFRYRDVSSDFILLSSPLIITKECIKDPYILGWVNSLGGFDYLAFDRIEENYKVVQSNSYLPYFPKSRRVISKSQQKSIILSKTVNLEELKGLSDLFVSPYVFRVDKSFNFLNEVFVETSNYNFQNFKDYFYDFQVEISEGIIQ